MHPTFMSAEPVGASIEIPAPGDIIKVDFQDRTNFSQPLYLGRVAQGTLINTEDNPAKQIFVNIRDGGELRTDGGLSGAGIPITQMFPMGKLAHQMSVNLRPTVLPIKVENALAKLI